MDYFTNKVIWITGASSGIGRALAVELAGRNTRIIVSARSVERLEKLKKELEPVNSNIAVLPLDLSETETLAEKAETAKKIFGPIDILVNNAGVSQRSMIHETDFSVVEYILKVDFLGAAALTMATLGDMYARGSGHVVVVSSLMGKFGTPLRSGYNAAKHAVQGFFSSLYAEAWRKNVNVTLIVPGWVRTEVTKNALEGDGSPHAVIDPGQARAGGPEEYLPKILRAISRKRFECLVALNAKTRFALFLSRFVPGVLRVVMRKAKVL